MGRTPLPIDLVGDGYVAREDIPHEGWDGVARVIPKGFPSDLASLPPGAGFFLPRHSEDRARAALPHDLYYRLQIVSKHAADRMFLRDLVLENGYLWRAALMYLAVKWFGGRAWKKNAKTAATERALWEPKMREAAIPADWRRDAMRELLKNGSGS